MSSPAVATTAVAYSPSKWLKLGLTPTLANSETRFEDIKSKPLTQIDTIIMAACKNGRGRVGVWCVRACVYVCVMG